MADASCPSSNSVQTVVTSLIANGVIFLIFLAAFVMLRPRQKKLYDSRNYSSEVAPQDKPRPVRSGPLGWLVDIMTRPDSEIIRDAGMDGYFFLRYLRFLFYIACLGMIIIMPILLPVNATNGANCSGFDLLAYGNITNSNRYYAHVFLSWIFFGLVLFFLYRELLFYVGTRQAVLTGQSEKYLISNRTVLVNDVPEKYHNEDYLRSIFNGVRFVFISRNASKLRDAIEKRDKLASKLEGTENSMLKKALKKRLKAEKKGKVSDDVPADIADYIKKPPTHRLGLFNGKLPLFGRKVESIPYLKDEIKKINEEVEKLQTDYNNNEKSAAAFIVFETQYDAEVAVQMLTFHRPLQMSPRTVGVHPDEVVWSNLDLRWYTRLPYALLASTFCTALVIFWAIPVAFAGFISQISHLQELFPWLSFLNNLPTVLYGLISSLLPLIILSLLMSLLPAVIRKAARLAGAPTNTLVEYYTQEVYYWFQIIQVFFVMTLSSSILAALNEILADPKQILTLLRKNLPQASNIFIAYLLLQALTIPSGMLLQIVAVILHHVLGTLLDNTPRKIWARQNGVGGTGWGTVYPVYSCLAVIMLVYSIIAPLILPFAAALFLFVYIAYLNNLTFCTAKTNGRGINYAKGLQHLFVGIYIAELILIVLFVFAKSWGPLVLEVVMGLFTVWFQRHFKGAFDPMLFALPRSLLDSTSSTYPATISKTKSDSLVKENPFEVQDAAETFSAQIVSGDVRSGKFFDRLFRPHVYYAPEVIQHELLTDNIWNEVPDLPGSDIEATAFDDPARNTDNPVVWFPTDPHGWAVAERDELRTHNVRAETSGSWYEINDVKKKLKIAVTDNADEVPIHEASPAY